jgi:cytochrome b561
MLLAVVRPDAWNLPLFFHIAGAMATVASLVVALYAVRIARTRGDQPATQFAARVLLRFTLPAFIVMRIAGQIVLSKEHLDKHTPNWAGIGFVVSDLGFLLLVIILILSGLMARRTKRGQSAAGSTQLAVTQGITGVLIVAYLVAIWAMTTKPT